MAYKYIDLDIELSDVEEFISGASVVELTTIIHKSNDELQRQNKQPIPGVWDLQTHLVCEHRTAAQQLACEQLQELITQLGPEEIVRRLTANLA